MGDESERLASLRRRAEEEDLSRQWSGFDGFAQQLRTESEKSVASRFEASGFAPDLSHRASLPIPSLSPLPLHSVFVPTWQRGIPKSVGSYLRTRDESCSQDHAREKELICANMLLFKMSNFGQPREAHALARAYSSDPTRAVAEAENERRYRFLRDRTADGVEIPCDLQTCKYVRAKPGEFFIAYPSRRVHQASGDVFCCMMHMRSHVCTRETCGALEELQRKEGSRCRITGRVYPPSVSAGRWDGGATPQALRLYSNHRSAVATADGEIADASFRAHAAPAALDHEAGEWEELFGDSDGDDDDDDPASMSALVPASSRSVAKCDPPDGRSIGGGPKLAASAAAASSKRSEAPAGRVAGSKSRKKQKPSEEAASLVSVPRYVLDFWIADQATGGQRRVVAPNEDTPWHEARFRLLIELAKRARANAAPDGRRPAAPQPTDVSLSSLVKLVRRGNLCSEAKKLCVHVLGLDAARDASAVDYLSSCLITLWILMHAMPASGTRVRTFKSVSLGLVSLLDKGHCAVVSAGADGVVSRAAASVAAGGLVRHAIPSLMPASPAAAAAYSPTLAIGFQATREVCFVAPHRAAFPSLADAAPRFNKASGVPGYDGSSIVEIIKTIKQCYASAVAQAKSVADLEPFVLANYVSAPPRSI